MRKVFILLILVALILPAFAFPGLVEAASTKQDYYEERNGATQCGPGWDAGQSFNATATYNLTFLKLKLGYNPGLPPGIVYINIYTADASGYPTGASLGNATIDGSLLTQYDSSDDPTTFSFLTPVSITTGTVYDIVISATVNVARVHQQSSGTYAGGKAIRNTGGGWADETGYDDWFATYSGYDAPTLYSVVSARVHTTSSVTISFQTASFGGAPTITDYHIAYGTSSSNYPYSSTPSSYNFTGDDTVRFDVPLSSLLPKKIYYYICSVTTVGGTVTSSEQTFTTSSGTNEGATVYSIDGDWGSNGGLEALRLSTHRKLWYALDRYWLFAFTLNTSIHYPAFMSTADGITWTSQTSISTTTQIVSSGFNSWWDGTYFHVVYSIELTGNYLYYRRGTPAVDGTIAWVAEQIVAGPSAGGDFYVKPSVACDSNGYPIIAYGLAGAPTDKETHIIRSTVTNGTWTDDAAFSTTLGTGGYIRPVVLPLTSGKVYVTTAQVNGTPGIVGKAWNGTAWGAPETPIASEFPLQYTPSYSATANDDDVYVTYVSSASDIRMVTRVYGSGWSSPETICSSSASGGITQVISPTNSSTVYVFWAGSPNPYTFYYRAKVSGIWEDATEFKYEPCAIYSTYTSYYFPMALTVTANPPNRTIGAIWFGWEDSITTDLIDYRVIFGSISFGPPENLTGSPLSTSISLAWIMGVFTDSSLIRYSTVTYPTTTGSGTLAYSGTSFSCLVSSLSPGTTYYFSAWGVSDETYTSTYITAAVTTSAYTTTPGEYVTPETPPGWLQATDYTKMSNLDPFYTGINNFIDATGADMTAGWIFLWLILVTIVTLIVMFYKGFQAGLIVMMIFMTILIFSEQLPGWMLFFVIIAGVGVWSLTHGGQPSDG